MCVFATDLRSAYWVKLFAIHGAWQDVPRKAKSAMVDSTMPEAPRVWPVQALVELACNVGGNSAAIATASIAVVGRIGRCYANSDSQLHWHLRWLWPVLLAWPCGLLILQGVVRTYEGIAGFAVTTQQQIRIGC